MMQLPLLEMTCSSQSTGQNDKVNLIKLGSGWFLLEVAGSAQNQSSQARLSRENLQQLKDACEKALRDDQMI
jgi:flagellar biogenesis protein FliO